MKKRAEKAAAKIAMAGHFARMKKNENEKAAVPAPLPKCGYTITRKSLRKKLQRRRKKVLRAGPTPPPKLHRLEASPPKAPEVNESLRRDVANSDNIQLSKCVTTQRLKFEVEYALKRGTSDNVYSIEGTKKTALIDVPDKALAENLFGENKHSSSDFLILQHISPKRLDSISALLENRSDVAADRDCRHEPRARESSTALKPPDGVTRGVTNV